MTWQDKQKPQLQEKLIAVCSTVRKQYHEAACWKATNQAINSLTDLLKNSSFLVTAKLLSVLTSLRYGKLCGLPLNLFSKIFVSSWHLKVSLLYSNIFCFPCLSPKAECNCGPCLLLTEEETFFRFLQLDMVNYEDVQLLISTTNCTNAKASLIVWNVADLKWSEACVIYAS